MIAFRFTLSRQVFDELARVVDNPYIAHHSALRLALFPQPLSK